MEFQSVADFGSIRGLRVLDVGNMIAGPFCATLLADHGADVIKLEHPASGDPMRLWPPSDHGRALRWKVSARNKRLITLNLSVPDGQAVLRELVKTSDIVVENFRPGTMERWGLSFAALEALRPGLVMVRVSGYGQTGPYRHRPGYGTVAEAMSGIPSFTGFPDRPPQLSAFALADYVAGLFGAFSALAAVYNRDRTGQGQEIDVSLFEPMFRLVEPQVIGYATMGIVKRRVGNRIEEDSPRNAYQTKDGEYVAISASSPTTWQRFATAIGREDLITNPKFIDNASRCRNDKELDDIITAWFCDRTLSEATEILERHDVVYGPVYDIAKIFSDAQYAAREAIVDVPDPDYGSVKMQGVVPKFSRTPGRICHPGLEPGHDNEDVYLRELSMPRDRYEALRHAGVI